MSGLGGTPKFPRLGLARAVLVAAIEDVLQQNEATEEASSVIAGAAADAIVANNEELERQLRELLGQAALAREYPRS